MYRGLDLGQSQGLVPGVSTAERNWELLSPLLSPFLVLGSLVIWDSIAKSYPLDCMRPLRMKV